MISDPLMFGFVLYLLVVATIGLLAYRNTRSMKDFALGGGKLGPLTIALSERASGESAWLLLGMTGAAMVSGIYEAWTAFGIVVGIGMSWTFVAGRLNDETRRLQVSSLPELLGKKYDSAAIKWIASAIITFFFTFYVASQFAGAAKVFSVTFGISPIVGMLLGGLLIVAYTLMGGFLAVAWTDVFQACLMFCTLVVLPIVGYLSLPAENTAVLFDTAKLYGGKEGMDAFLGIVGGLSWGLGYLGQPHLLARYMAARSSEDIAIGRKVAMAWAIPAFTGGILMGLVGSQLMDIGFFGDAATQEALLADSEKLMPAMATLLLPGVVAGLFISGAIAAMMSTADSQLLVTSTVIANDVYKEAKPAAKDNEVLRIGRIATIGVGLLALILALNTDKIVYSMVSYAWSGLGASFGPAVVCTLWWRKTSRIGVLAGLLGGATFTVFDVTGGLVTVRLTSFLIALLLVVFGSLFFPDRERTQ